MKGRRLVVPGFANKLVAALPRFLPRGLVLTLIHNSQKSRSQPKAEEGWPRRRAERP
jgi:short-subunit dehydrogenase